MIEENVKIIKSWTELFLKKIFDPESINSMPKEVRLIAKTIFLQSEALKLNTRVLLGGYVFLRFFNPCIATPEIFNIINPKIKTKKGQRTLLLITKLLQNIANQVPFKMETKEPFMAVFNDYVTNKFDEMTKYLLSVANYEEKGRI